MFFKTQEADRIVSIGVLYNTNDGCCLPPLEIQLMWGHFKGIDVPRATFYSEDTEEDEMSKTGLVEK